MKLQKLEIRSVGLHQRPLCVPGFNPKGLVGQSRSAAPAPSAVIGSGWLYCERAWRTIENGVNSELDVNRDAPVVLHALLANDPNFLGTFPSAARYSASLVGVFDRWFKVTRRNNGSGLGVAQVECDSRP